MESAKLPNLDHFSYRDGEFVYQPAEDTFLLCDGILSEKEFIRELRPKVAVEVGCGSGCVIVYTRMLIREIFGHDYDCSAIATDINPKALAMAEATAKANHTELTLVQTDLVTALEADYTHRIDILIFNPPYVPTESEEIAGSGIEASWAGGIDGREVIDRFLPKIPVMLSDRGVCYMILVKENKPNDIALILRNEHQLHMEIIARKQAVNEDLMVAKITRTPL